MTTEQTRQKLSLAAARARREKVGFKPSDIDHPSFIGVRVLEDVPLDALVPHFDWRYFEAARESYDTARSLLDEIVQGKLLRARAVYGFWPALSIGDDIVVYRAESLREEVARFAMLRQQDDHGEGEPTTSLADFIAPKQSGLTDFIGAFACTAGIGVEELASKHDHPFIIEALAERLAEALAAWLHARARKEFGYGAGEQLSPEELRDEKYRGIRPAFGSPAAPDHDDRRTLFTLLGARGIGMELGEQLAMTPAASASGLYFAHPKAHYFSVGAIAKDQVEDYAARKNVSVHEVERRLRSNLAYDPGQVPPSGS